MGQYTTPDYYLLNELPSEEHLLIRKSIRRWVDNELLPVIEDHTRRTVFPNQVRCSKAKRKPHQHTISPAKRNNVAAALHMATEARPLAGATGITGEAPIMRHMMNLGPAIAYGCTHGAHLLTSIQF